MTKPEDLRKFVIDASRAIGNSELGEDVTSGRMEADAISPLLAGMIRQQIVQGFIPVVGAQDFVEFDPEERPLRATITMLDGSKLTVILESSRD